MSAEVPAETCIVNGISVEMYNKSQDMQTMNYYYLAPIKCSAWLGALDSAWNRSWFSSSCFSILKNRFTPSIASVSKCDVDTYTTGCRYLDSDQHFVPECRKSSSSSSSSSQSYNNNNDDECGVNVQCPDQNPCGLGRYIETNLDSKFSACNTKTHLALNVSVTEEENCYSWNEYAFWLDGFCVSSCGRIDNQCVLDGVTVPKCVTVRDYNHDNAILSNSPEICSVPMPYNSFAGFRNGFYGMSRDIGSKCLAVTNCSNSPYMCVKIEGLDISPLADAGLINKLPFCMGNPNIQCKIEYPCYEDGLIQPEKCGVLGVSYWLYTAMMGVYSNNSCNDWLKYRDIVTIVCLVIVFFFCLFGYYSANDKSESVCFAWTALMIVGLVCALVWEFAMVLGGVGFTTYFFYHNNNNTCCGLCGGRTTTGYVHIPTEKITNGVTNIRLNPSQQQ